mmetsp:Transcript_14039/g.13599  ORF Transcript_14039/g.13599 Transcript_14039/m.13599 type:complete len:168 (+) Transcript_14039:122-625(+)
MKQNHQNSSRSSNNRYDPNNLRTRYPRRSNSTSETSNYYRPGHHTSNVVNIAIDMPIDMRQIPEDTSSYKTTGLPEETNESNINDNHGHEGEGGEYKMQHARSEPSQTCGCLWNDSPSLSNPHENCRVGGDGDRTQIGNPNGMRCRSERETNDNNLTHSVHLREATV